MSTPNLNPFTGYLVTLDVLFYPAPTSGFKDRTVILYVVFGLAILMACSQLGLYIIDGRRRNSSIFWAFRLVQRSSGGLIVTNTKLFGTTLSIINLTAQLAYTYTNYSVYADHASQSHLYEWRALPTFSLLIQGWLLSWGLLQAYVLTQEKYDLAFRPRTLNWLFVGGGVAVCSAVLATGIWNSIAGNRVWSEYVVLVDALRTLEAGWTPGSSSLAGLLPLAPALASLKSASASYKTASSVEFAIAGAVSLFLSLLNLGGISLTRLLRRQISIKSGQIGQTSGFSSTETSEGVKSSQGSGDLPSRSKIRRMARNNSLGADSELAKQLVVLQKAERDLLYTSAAQSLVTTAAAAILIAIVVTTKSGIVLTEWKILEFATTGVQWLYACTLFVVFALLNFNTLLRSHHSQVGSSHAVAPVQTPAPVLSSPEMGLTFEDFFPATRGVSPFPTRRPPAERITSSVRSSEYSESDEKVGEAV